MSVSSVAYSLLSSDHKVEFSPKRASKYFQVDITGTFVQPKFTVWRLLLDPGDNNVMMAPDQRMLDKMNLQEVKKMAVTFIPSTEKDFNQIQYRQEVTVFVTFDEEQEYIPEIHGRR